MRNSVQFLIQASARILIAKDKVLSMHIVRLEVRDDCRYRFPAVLGIENQFEEYGDYLCDKVGRYPVV